MKKNINRVLSVILALLMIATVLPLSGMAADGDTAIPVSSIAMSEKTLSLLRGESATLEARVEPTDASDRIVIWESSDLTVATVKNGVVTAVSDGTADIKAISKSDITKFDICKVTVTHNHVFSTYTYNSDATCVKDGTETAKCNFCAETETRASSTHKALGHDFSSSEITKAATCTVAGSRTYTCSRCKETKIEAVAIDSNNHVNKENVEAVAATCAQVGYTSGVYCNDCKKYVSGHDEIAMISHKWNDGEITTIATCTVKGVKTFTCTECKKTKTEDLGLDVNNHNTVEVPAEAAVCGKAGHEAGVYCNDCKKYVSGGKTIPALEHDFSENVVTKAATCSETGIRTYTCSKCKTTKTEEIAIDKNNHVALNETAAVAPTKTSIGYTAGKYCNDCKKYISGHEVIPMLLSVSITGEKDILYVGDTLKLGASITGGVAAENVVSWSNSNSLVATVDNGIVTPKANGSVKITVKVSYGTDSESASCDILIKTHVDGVKLSLTEKVLYIGETETLNETVSPATASDKAVTWKSSNDAVATVVGGKITAVSNGTADITVTTNDGAKTATCKVTVKTHVSDIKLDVSNVTININESKTLSAIISPVTASDKTVKWTSSDTKVATVAGGVVTAKAEGKATITATTVDGNKTASCEVTVVIPVTGVTLNKTSLLLVKGDKRQLVAKVLPENATNQAVIWTCDNDKVTVDQTGLVTAMKSGNATVTVTTVDGSKTATCNVVVIIPVTGVSLDITEKTVNINEAFNLKSTIAPADATNQKVTWSSDDTSVATVDSNGRVTPVFNGLANITVTTDDGKYTATCAVNVQTKVTGVSLSSSSVTLRVGQSCDLSAIIEPSTASDRTVTWSVSPSNIAKVTYGHVTALAYGNAVVTAQTKDGNFKATCVIKVTSSMTELSLSPERVTVSVGESVGVKATITPASSSKLPIIWTSSDSKIATVNALGIITGVKNGNATITATVYDGEKNADGTYDKDVPKFEYPCEVTVITAAKGVSVRDAAEVKIGATYQLEAVIKANSDEVTDAVLSWKSSDTSVATVDNVGLVSGLKAGTAVITVTVKTANNVEFSDTCNVTVITPVSGVALSPSSVVLNPGDLKSVLATISPADATYTDVTWQSSNPEIVSVDNDGIIKAVALGNAVITATTKDGGFKATCEVTVVVPVSGVSLDIPTAELFIGANVRLTETVLPADAADKSVTWVSDNPNVATVNAGLVTAVAEGTANISVITNDGKYKATCAVSVTGTLGGDCGDNLKWTFNSTAATLSISGSGNMTEYASASQTPWADYNNKIKILVVREGVSSVSNYAFEGLRSLVSVTLPSSLTRIGRNCFSGCTSMTQINIPSQVKAIEAETFMGCGALESIILPESVSSIGADAFKSCISLNTVTISDRDCVIYDKTTTISDLAVICAFSGSSAYKYSKKYNREFYSIGACIHDDGDGDLICDNCDECIIADQAVKGFKVSSVTSTTLKLSWISIDMATGYRVYKYNPVSKQYEGYKNVTATSLTVSGLAANSYVYFRVRAYKIINGTTYWATLSAPYRTFTAPAKVPVIKATSSSTSIKLIWSKLDGATGYLVYKYNPKTKKYENFKTSATNTLTVTGLSSNTAYYFKVRAYKTVSKVNYWGDTSNFIRTCTGPAKVNNLKVSYYNTTALKLTWNKVSGASGYRVFKYNPKTKAYEACLNVKTNAAIIKGLKAGTTYFFMVSAYKTVSSVSYWGTSSNYLKTATRPLNSQVSYAASGAKSCVTVKYSAASGATGYAVQYSPSKTFSSSVVTKYTSSRNVTYKGLASGRIYYVRVRPFVLVNGVRVFSPAFSTARAVKIK